MILGRYNLDILSFMSSLKDIYGKIQLEPPLLQEIVAES